MNLAQAPDVGLGIGDRKDRLSNRRFVRDGVESAGLDGLLEALALDFDERDIDAVNRRAAHDSGYKHRLYKLKALRGAVGGPGFLISRGRVLLSTRRSG